MKVRIQKFYVVVFAVTLFFGCGQKKNTLQENVTLFHPEYGQIRNFVSTTGDVEPQNRLELKPPIDGRIDEILVKEGQNVKVGDVVALMSSTKRATLLDAARLRSAEELEYWKKVYNATPLIAPINGSVIVRSVEPGQTVSASDAVIVLSDRLIVSADVDEVDIGKVKEGQEALITLDAYPDIKVSGVVDHISYESTVVNNVTIYEVEIVPDDIPAVFRSGMSANVEIVTAGKDNVLLISLDAVNEDERGFFVMIKKENGEVVPKQIVVGSSDSENYEVISGLTENDIVVLQSEQYFIPQSSSKNNGNPFMPDFDKNKKKKQG